jgi:mono/diheme cytochrome c family protein
MSESDEQQPISDPENAIEVGAGRYFFFVICCLSVLAGMIYFSLRIPPPPAPPEVKADPVLSRGYEIYMRQCVPCHGLQGRGDGPRSYSAAIKPRNLKEEEWKYGDDEQSVRKIIMQGGPNGVMPAFQATLSPREVDSIVKYIVHLKNH